MPAGQPVDVLGIGFGPANVALAIAISENNESDTDSPISTKFLEKSHKFGWHRGMLLEGATMQVAFLKDLVTLRNPSSRFSFVSYLHARGRLIDFINHKCLYPSRIEFHDYLDWCAAEMAPMVEYGHEVVSARPVTDAGRVVHFEVIARDERDGSLTLRTARNLVVAPGLTARMPTHLPVSAHVWHSSTFLADLDELKTDEPRRFVVLGAGQSAAEIADHLHRTFPRAEVYAVLSRIGYSQADDSPMANRVFDPATVDVFHSSPPEVKASLMAYHANTNYSVVDAALIEELYRRVYQEKVAGISRFRLLNVSTVAGVQEGTDAVEVTIKDLPSGSCTTVTADALICATGYEPTDPLSVLGDVSALLERDAQRRLKVMRDYRIASTVRMPGGIYLCGATEHTHGITSSLLSNAAVRAGEILSSVRKRRAAMDLPTHADHVVAR